MFNPQPKTKAWRSKEYLKWIREQPVIIPGQGETVAHHVRIDCNAGTSLKPSDYYCVPIPKIVHDNFHAGKYSNKEFFEMNGIDIYKELFLLTSRWIEHRAIK